VEVEQCGEMLGIARVIRQKEDDLEEVRPDPDPRAKRQQPRSGRPGRRQCEWVAARGRLPDMAYEELVMEDESGAGDQDLEGDEALQVHDGVAMARSRRAGAGMASPAPISLSSRLISSFSSRRGRTEGGRDHRMGKLDPGA
jgi:hypothetical protein